MDSFHGNNIGPHPINNNGVFSHQNYRVGIHPIVCAGKWTKTHVSQKTKNMLYTIAVVLVVLWLLGLVTSYTLGGFVHILLVIAIIMAIVNLVQGRRL